MNQSLIRWRKEDSIALQRAINTFNRNVRKLERQEDSVKYLPNTVNYNELRESIISRNELNRVISSLRSFSKKGSTDIIEVASGQKITKWEYEKINKSRSIALRNLNKEVLSLETSHRLSLMGNAKLEAAKATIKNLSELENKKGSDFTRIKERIYYYGYQDVELKRAMQFRKNFEDNLAQMTSYDNSDILMKKLNQIKNPIKFYEFINQSTTIKDLVMEMYKDKATAQTYGGFASNQDAFIHGLEELGLL